MYISDRTDLTYHNGYYIVSKLTVRLSKDDKTPYLHKCTPKTFAHLSGARNKLIEYNEDVSNLEELAEQAKLEAGIEAAKKANKIRERGGIK